MDQPDPSLDLEPIDLVATRPPLAFGVPFSLFGWLAAAAVVGWYFITAADLLTELMYNAIWFGVIVTVWSAAKIMLRKDYHGWDIFVSWLRTELAILDTREWGGSHLSSLPLRSVYRCGWSERQ